MPAKKKKLSWYRVGNRLYRLSPRVRALAFVALFGVIGGSGYLAFGASAAVNNRAFGGSCNTSTLGRVDVSANFDNLTTNGAVLDYVVISTDNDLASQLPITAHYADGSSQVSSVTYKSTGKLSNTGLKQYRADPEFGLTKITKLSVYAWKDGTPKADQVASNKMCSVEVSPRP